MTNITGVESVDDDSESDTAEDDSEEEEMEMSKELLEVSNYKQITTTTTSQSRPQNCIFSEEQSKKFLHWRKVV